MALLVSVSSVAVSLSRLCQHLSLPLLGSAIFPHRTISITIYSRNIQNTQVIQNTLESDSKAKMDLSFPISSHVFGSPFFCVLYNHNTPLYTPHTLFKSGHSCKHIYPISIIKCLIPNHVAAALKKPEKE